MRVKKDFVIKANKQIKQFLNSLDLLNESVNQTEKNEVLSQKEIFSIITNFLNNLEKRMRSFFELNFKMENDYMLVNISVARNESEEDFFNYKNKI